MTATPPNNIELRDWFAGMALHALITSGNEDIEGNAMATIYFGVDAGDVGTSECFAAVAYCIADTMMKLHNKAVPAVIAED